MVWKMWCLTLQSMGRTNHKFPLYPTYIQSHLKSTVFCKPQLTSINEREVTMLIKKAVWGCGRLRVLLGALVGDCIPLKSGFSRLPS